MCLWCLLFFVTSKSYSQYTNNIWCFGDSAGIRFDNNPTPISSGVIGRFGAAAISDANGDLLFYTNSHDYYLWLIPGLDEVGIIKSKDNSTMLNGDSIVATWYRDMLIVPKSNIDSTFYVFTAGVTPPHGFYYNLVDLKQNNGLGYVVQKNIQLQSFPVNDGIIAIKHGNGKSWWILFEDWGPFGTDSSDAYYTYLVDSNGISNVNLQHIGSYHKSNGCDVTFNYDGTKFAFTDLTGYTLLADFDRCTGIISNPIEIEPIRYGMNALYYENCIFSPNNRFLYTSSYGSPLQKPSYLYQYDLDAANISTSRLLIDSIMAPAGTGSMELGPDKKIYLTCAYEGPGSSYPYPDSIHNYITDNLSVINFPDSFGVACDFQKFSFNLGGRRTYYGLPNNPDYTMGALTGSPCDTITSIREFHKSEINRLKVFYHSQWDIVFINADQLKGNNYIFHVYDITGKEIFTEKGKLQPPYFTKDLSMSPFSKGMYIGVLESERERITGRFVKY